jgi:adenine-specific DNA-methyltransferase
MAGWLFERKLDVLLDPGAGSGALLIAAANHAERGNARLLGVDIDPIAIQMLKANKRVRQIDGLTTRKANFLTDELHVRPDGITCNPPYSRHHDMSAAEKRAIHEGFGKRLRLNLSRLCALHALFLVRALEVSRKGARIAFITPSDWLDMNYGRKVKELLLNRAQVEAIVLLDTEHLFFDGALTTAAITFLRNEKPSIAETTKILRLDRELPEPSVVLKLLKAGKDVDEVMLVAESKWSRPAATPRSGVRLGDVARIRRGVATGANGFFVLSERRRKELRIPTRKLRPCLASPRVIPGTEVSEEALAALDLDVPRWILNSADPAEQDANTALGAYLRCGRDELQVHQGYLTSRRKPWYAPELRGDCPIVFSYFNRSRPRFLRNRAKAVPLNTWLIIEPSDGLDPDVLHQALTTETTMKQLEEQARVYGGGLWKLEPSELSEIRLSEKHLNL